MMHLTNFSMGKAIGFCAVVGLWMATGVTAAQQYDYRGNTLDFVNITGGATPHIVQTVPEDGAVEKSVEYGDIDNDNDMDVVIAVARGAFGQRVNKMYMNEGGIFTEVSGTAIMPEFSSPDTSRHAFLRDYDNDGWLDLIVINDGNSGTTTYQSPGRTKFFHNKHPNGVFTHFENETGRLDNASGAACSGFSFDVDQNGLDDLFMANYPFTSQDTLYLNGILGSPAGMFTDVTTTNLPVDSDYAVDANAGDMNGDGKINILVNSGSFDPNYIHYNDNLGQGSGLGDFAYSSPTNSQSTSFPTTSYKGAMVPADFDCDGRVDFLYVNKGGFSSNAADVIMHNMGNDVTSNKAIFAEHNLSPHVNTESQKATVKDLDGDGKPDIIVMSEQRRPYIFRNASTPGNIKFIEWTPRSAFPTAGSPHAGWHANAFDTDDDARPDIFLGGLHDDHLFKNVPSVVYNEDDLPVGGFGLAIPVFHNDAPATVIGNAAKDELDIYRAEGITVGSTVSVYLRSFSDVELHIKDENAALIAVIDDGLAHVAEAHEFSAPGGDLIFAVLMKRVSGDGNEDGRVNLQDARMIRSCFMSNDPACLIFDFDNNGRITLQDSRLFRSQFQIGQATGEYVLELNSRSD